MEFSHDGRRNPLQNGGIERQQFIFLQTVFSVTVICNDIWLSISARIQEQMIDRLDHFICLFEHRLPLAIFPEYLNFYCLFIIFTLHLDWSMWFSQTKCQYDFQLSYPRMLRLCILANCFNEIWRYAWRELRILYFWQDVILLQEIFHHVRDPVSWVAQPVSTLPAYLLT